jgi:hypothetical protein
MNIWQRLEKLEAGDSSRHPPIVWRNHDETEQQARARWCADNQGEDPETELMFIGWLPPTQPALPS